MRYAAVLIALLTLAACGGGPTPYQRLQAGYAERDRFEANNRHDLLKPLREFEAEAPPSCESKSLAKARLLTAHWANLMTPRTHGLTAVFNAGSMQLDIADSARRHGCATFARDIYETVLARYVGTAYGGLRDRAATGLAELRR